jgi:biopolymer transport protein TolR
MKLTPLQKRAERAERNKSAVDLNLVALIDIFTILIFFLLSSASGVELLSIPKAVTLPESLAEQPTRQTIVVSVNGQEILVEGRKVASVAEVMASPDDLIAPLQAELQALAARAPAPADAKMPAADSRRVTIMGDKDIPYSLLRKVMVSAARADFADVSFAVRQKFAS